MSRATQAYRRVYIESSTPAKCLDEVFTNLLSDCVEARRCLAARDIAGKARRIDRALGIVSGLCAALDHKQAPELCARLATLYDFVRARLLHGSMHLDARAISEAERVLETLCQAFREAGAAPA